MSDYYKKDKFCKQDSSDDQNCITCGFHKVKSEKPGNTNFVSKNSLCLIKNQITTLHEQILGCQEDDEIAKPTITLSKDIEFFATEQFEEFKKEHQGLLKNFFDAEAYAKKSCPNLKAMDEVEFVFIETAMELQVMLNELSNCKNIAINLEYYSQRSYLGFTWLLQISTEDVYYMINCLKLQNELHDLNRIFMNNTILKIFHDGDNAILRLYKDFGIFLVNIFDTAILIKKIMESKEKDLIETIDTLKTTRTHTHFLIFLKIILTNSIIKSDKRQLLKSMRRKCIEICEKVHHKIVWNRINFKNINDDKVTNRERYIATELLKWRDGIAQKEDESSNFIIPDNLIFKIARELLHKNTNTLYQCNGKTFMDNKETGINVDEIVIQAQRMSIKGKNRQWFKDQQTHRAIENKFNIEQVEENHKVFEAVHEQDKKITQNKMKIKRSKREPKVKK